MSGPYCELVEEIADYVPPLDPDGFYEALDLIDARLVTITDRPSKQELRLALHTICRANANRRFAELKMVTRF